ncbi:MAG: cupin domain-containing protein [Candidatus Uhrbacteria bacterium]|nr:cupin domain-containing protein [Candidatus Uhrbacteria bacterium]
MHTFLLDNANVILDRDFLTQQGILSWQLGTHTREREQTLASICSMRGYMDQDEVQLDKNTPDLETKLVMFFQEHRHEDEEIRLILEGNGIFDIRDADDRWMRIMLSPGDLIIIPANRFHRFTLDTHKSVVARRLFKNKNGWKAIPREFALNHP